MIHIYYFNTVGVVYFTLGNLPPTQRSQVNAIQLLAIATSPVIKEYGIDAILEPFMNDLELLEQVNIMCLCMSLCLHR